MKATEVWKAVSSGNEVVLTSQGKPVALLTAVSGEDLERQIKAIRRAKPQLALERCWQNARETGEAELSLDEIDRRIADVRRARRTAPRSRR